MRTTRWARSRRSSRSSYLNRLDFVTFIIFDPRSGKTGTNLRPRSDSEVLTSLNCYLLFHRAGQTMAA